MIEDMTQYLKEAGLIGRALCALSPQVYLATSIKDLKESLPQEIARRQKENNPVKTMGPKGSKYCIVMTDGAYNIEPLQGIDFHEPREFVLERATITDLSNNLRIFYTADGPMPKLRTDNYDALDTDETTRIYSPVFFYEVTKNRLLMAKFSEDMQRPLRPDGKTKRAGPLELILAGARG